MSLFNYTRRNSREVKVRDMGVGGDNPVRIQSMTNTNTNDTMGSVRQIENISKAGGEIVRLTTQGVREAENLGLIRDKVRAGEFNPPLVADVHFNPNAAMVAARTADKVRINPGNFVDAARTFKKLEFTDEEYKEEIGKIRAALRPFINICKENGTAVRLGVNHGSLSDRIMSRYGDTPAGMVESVMEYLRICEELDFHDIVISIKASNTLVMTETVRLLCKTMDAEGMNYPLHLGVTEAGDGEDGRIKSAAGIGALMAEGIGDTIRVSLSEPPENEIPVAIRLRDYFESRAGHDPIAEPTVIPTGNERDLASTDAIGKSLVALHHDYDSVPDSWHLLSAGDIPALFDDNEPVILSSSHTNRPGEVASWLCRFRETDAKNPVIVNLLYDENPEQVKLMAAADFGALLLNGYANGISVEAPEFSKEELGQLELDILQATRLRMSKTEYIACPSCGRTLFDLQTTLAKVKEATKDLKGLKIGVMGCIVNGPGEMADADYGYVGAGPGRVSIYRGKELVIKNVESEKALPMLLELIRNDREDKKNDTYHSTL